jgi:uncharacterized coiled-coil DUF342 family protein
MCGPKLKGKQNSCKCWTACHHGKWCECIIGEMSDKMDEMSDKMDEMSDKMGEMSDKMGEMSDKMGEMSDKMGEMSDKIFLYIQHKKGKIPIHHH